MKYYTAFGFNKYPIKDIHCTHKFLGDISLEDENKVVEIIDSYFKKNVFVGFKESFSEEKHFGLSNEIRVLIPVNSTKDLYFLDLRDQLSLFKKDDYVYQPHISTENLVEISDKFDYFCLVKNNKIIKKWF